MKTNIRYVLLSLCLALFVGFCANANNIQITSVPSLAKTVVGGQIQSINVSFDMSWENSWKLAIPNNNDAAWVFVKYRVDAGKWMHAYLNGTGHSVGAASNPTPANIEIKPGTSNVSVYGSSPTSKYTGVFIQRKTQGYGAMDLKNVTLNWKTDDLGMDPATVISVRVFAIEMVYIPKGEFNLGDDISNNRLVKYGDFIAELPFMEGNTGNAAGAAISRFSDPGTFTFPTSLLPGMTSASAPATSTITASVNPTTAWQAFDASGATVWTITANTWQYIQYTNSANFTPNWALIKMNNASGIGVKGFYIQGSSDGGATWKTLYGSDVYVDPPTVYGAWTYRFQHLVAVPIRFDVQNESINAIRFNFFTAGSVNVYDIQLYQNNADDVNTITSENELYLIPSIAATSTPANYTTFPKLTANYPKGYNAFYIMKHEVTQAAYVDFLNTLTYDQQKEHSVIAPNAAVNTAYYANTRNLIKIRKVGNDGPATYGLSADNVDWDPENNAGNVPMFNMSWSDVMAYLQWAALRPLTELEYEKACRGGLDQASVPYEYAWGAPYLSNGASSVTDKNLSTETPVPAASNYAPAGPAGGQTAPTVAAVNTYWPVRAGSFATGSSTRVDAGASYWGVLNLSDNVPERYVNVSTNEGRAFTGEHGDGNLLQTGVCNVTGWPLAYSGQGTGFRGVALSAATTITNIFPVSDRTYAASLSGSAALYRDLWSGCRGGRTADK